MTTLNAAITDTQKKFQLAAAIDSLYNSNISSKAGPYANFDLSNDFTIREQLATCNTYVSTSINKYALTQTKGMHFEGKAAAKKAVESAAKKINLRGQIATIGRYFVIHGTYMATTAGKGNTFQALPLLPSATTILPDGIEPGKIGINYILEPPIAQFCVNEAVSTSEVKTVSLPAEEVVYCAINPYDSIQRDILKRKTRGLYGQSPLDPLKPAIMALLDVNQGQTTFYKKYGNGRYLYNIKALEAAVIAGEISAEDAQKALDLWMEKQKNLSANEDLVCYGMDVKQIDASGSLDVMSFKSALETEIMIGLYQSPLTMGASFQTTYASSYMVEEDRMVVMEANQSILKETANQLVSKLAVSMGYKDDSVTVEFEELSKPKLDPTLVIDMANSGWITPKQLLDYTGFEDMSVSMNNHLITPENTSMRVTEQITPPIKGNNPLVQPNATTPQGA